MNFDLSGTAPTIEDELAGATERIGDVEEVRAGLSGESLGTRPTGSRHEEVVGGACSTDGIDDILDGGGPFRNRIEVMGFVHETENNPRVAAVLGGELSPEARELIVGRTSLADDSAVPASVVVL
jgi:hypothetical protein